MRQSPDKIFMPVCLDITDKNILIVGGGPASFHKIQTIRQYTARITIVALCVCDEIRKAGYRIIEKAYEPGDLIGFHLVYACTNDKVTNAGISKDAKAKGIPVNVCDDPELSGFISPAIYKEGPMSVAVSSNGRDVKKSVEWRNKIREALSDDPA